MENYQQLQNAADASARAQAPGCDPIPMGVPVAGGIGDTTWMAMGSMLGKSEQWLACRNGRPLEDQYEAQVARFTGKPLPAGVKIEHIVRSARYLLVQGNAVAAESDLHAAGYKDAFAGSPNWVLLRYENVANA